VSKERARTRAARAAAAEKEKAKRARKVARRLRRQALLRSLKPRRRRRTGRLFVRRSRAQRIGLVVVPLLVVGAVWVLVDDPALRLLLLALFVIALPALVVVVLGRRSS
jgi:DNA-binding TFAR19-related protein (PDSD5 family)